MTIFFPPLPRALPVSLSPSPQSKKCGRIELKQQLLFGPTWRELCARGHYSILKRSSKCLADETDTRSVAVTPLQVTRERRDDLHLSQTPFFSPPTFTLSARMYTQIQRDTHTNACNHMRMRAHAYIRKRTHACTHNTRTHLHTHMRARTQAHTCNRVRACARTHARTHIAYTHKTHTYGNAHVNGRTDQCTCTPTRACTQARRARKHTHTRAHAHGSRNANMCVAICFHSVLVMCFSMHTFEEA